MSPRFVETAIPGVVVVEVAALWASAIVCWRALSVAASTAPVGGTPRADWKAINASVSSGVQVPSTGPVQ